jgi:hypothetical protein
MKFSDRLATWSISWEAFKSRLEDFWDSIAYPVDENNLLQAYEDRKSVIAKEANAVITKYCIKEMSESMNSMANDSYPFDFAHFGLIPVLPKDKVWIYNVSAQRHESSIHPVLGRNVIFPAVKEGEDYSVVTSIPRVMRYPKANVDSGDMSPVFEDGRRIAMDLINPDNLGLDQDATPMSLHTSGNGRNLGAKGVFWSLKNPPGKMEVRLAKKRMEMRYKFLLEQAETVLKVDPRILKEMITPEHHAAADYMGGSYVWHGERFEELKVLAREVEAVRYL